MATTITTASHGDCISGSPEKRLDVAADGTLWLAVVDVGRIRFFSSVNHGTTWSYSGPSDLSLGQDTAVPSMHIDLDGYAHVCFVQWQRDPQVIIYARGVPRSGGGWAWTTKTLSPAGGRIGVDSDIVAFRNGAGWVVWVAYTYDSGVTGAKVAKIDVAANGTISIGATVHGPSLNPIAYQIKALTFSNTGDGRTTLSIPNIFLITAPSSGSGTGWLNRAKYSSGTWTWETPQVYDASFSVSNTAYCTVFRNGYVFHVYAPTATTLKALEWDGGGASFTFRNPPALPGGTGNVLAVSLAVDASTNDVYLVAYGSTNGNIITTKYTDSTHTWSAWSTAVTRPASGNDGQLQLVRYVPLDSVDMVWAEGTGPYTIKSQPLTTLARAPGTPILITPPNGAKIDLASGATFVWQYSAVSPGDVQQAWAFRRMFGGGPTIEYWNASAQAWSSTIVWNATDPLNSFQAIFAPAKWTTGTTYSWSVATKSSTGATSAFATDRTVIAALTPNVDVISPDGIYYGESTPLVVWTYTSVVSQRDYQVRIVPTLGNTIDPNNPLPATWDSGVVTSGGARNARVVASLTDGTAYRAYVRCSDTAGAQSQWVYNDFTLSLLPPSGPLVEVIDEISYETNVPRIRLNLLARSNFLSAAAARGQAAWEVDANITLTAQPDDSANQLDAGLKFVSVAAGAMSARTSPGSPPAAPIGRPQPLGPLSFPVVAGFAYTGMGFFKTDLNVRAARVKIRWYDADDGTGALISESVGDQITTGTTSYVQGIVTTTAPAGAVLARLVVEVLGAVGAGEIYYVSRLSFQPGRVTAWQSGGYATTETIRVERSDDGGTTWQVVVDRVKPDVYQRASIIDREMPFGIDVKYRATTNVDVGGGSILTSALSPITTIVVDNPIWAIRNPDDVLAEFNAFVLKFDEKDSDDATVLWVAGREHPVIDTEGLRAPSGTMDIYVGPADIDTVTAILRSTVPMVMQSPVGRVYRARFIQRSYAPYMPTSRVISIDFFEVP